MKKSLVVGATGLVGTHVLKQLISIEQKPIALLRRIRSDLPKNVEVLEIDFDELLLTGTLPDFDHLYICLGTTIKAAGSKDEFKKVDFDYCLGIAKIAAGQGVSIVSLVSSVGADASSKNFYLKTKGEIEDAIKALDFKTVNIYRPGLLIGERLEKRSAEKIGQLLSKFIDPLMFGSFSKFRSIGSDTLAISMVNNANFNVIEGVNYYHFQQFTSD